MSLCKYKNMFGEPGEGIHSYRIGPFAAVDTAGTALLGYAISEYADIGLMTGMAIAFGSGIIAHKLFCVPTTINKYLI